MAVLFSSFSNVKPSIFFLWPLKLDNKREVYKPFSLHFGKMVGECCIPKCMLVTQTHSTYKFKTVWSCTCCSHCRASLWNTQRICLMKSLPYCNFCVVSINVAASEMLLRCGAFVFAVFEAVSSWKHTGVFQNAVCGFTVWLSAVGLYRSWVCYNVCVSVFGFASLSSADPQESRPL